MYGHTIPVIVELEEDTLIKVFYHGTTPEAAYKILKIGLRSMKRRWVHLSPTAEIAREVGLRRSRNPVILEINAEGARKSGLRFYKANDRVYVCGNVPPIFISVKV